jgi:hypothetical protein
VQFKQGVTDGTTPFPSDIDLLERFKILKDVMVKVNEKVQNLEQRILASQEVNMNETYYEIQSSRFEQVRDLGEVSERDILQEIEAKIDIDKEEELIESFIKEKSKQAATTSEIFSIYRLKSKVMNEKIDKIRKQFDD